jgi:hypothetical protein
MGLQNTFLRNVCSISLDWQQKHFEPSGLNGAIELSRYFAICIVGSLLRTCRNPATLPWTFRPPA